MARAQSGLRQTVQPESLLQIYSMVDMAMNAMSVSQFSVMIPGLASDLLKRWPDEKLYCTLGFSRMFWLLVWHTGLPRGFYDLEDLETEDCSFPVTEGDLMIHLSATRSELLDEMDREIRNNLKGMVTPEIEIRSSLPLEKSRDFQAPAEVPPGIFIGPEEPDFTQGSFVWVQKFVGQKPSSVSLPHLFQEKCKGMENPGQFMVRALPYENSNERGIVTLTHFRDSDSLEDLMIKLLEEGPGQKGMEWDSFPAVSGTSFFVPSVDVLIGLRMGGIRMNRFSTTRQFE
jgi:hypothetical protein